MVKSGLLLVGLVFSGLLFGKSLVEINQQRTTLIENQLKKNSYNFSDEQMLLLKKGYQQIDNSCSYCHLSPFDVANFYKQRRWIEEYSLNGLSLKDKINTRLYQKHNTSKELLDKLDKVMTNPNCKLFLHTYAIDSGNSRCLAK